MLNGRSLTIVAGAVTCVLLAIIAGQTRGQQMAATLTQNAQTVIASTGGAGVSADFLTKRGWATRHPVLQGGENLDETTRAKLARAVAAIPGVGGVRWSDGSTGTKSSKEPPKPLHCQDDVEALLRARSIRFEESSAAIAPASAELLDEVAEALRPCLGSIIAIVGHTDSSGEKAGNLALSKERAMAVQQALISRGIPADGMRSSGVGSLHPVDGLDPTDPANRRIDFSVIATVPIKPTPVDTPGPR